MKFKQALDFGRAFDFRRALTWLNWLYGCVFGAICLGYGIAFAGHALSLWELPHLSPLFTALSFGSAGCANLVSGLQKLSPRLRRPTVQFPPQARGILRLTRRPRSSGHESGLFRRERLAARATGPRSTTLPGRRNGPKWPGTGLARLQIFHIGNAKKPPVTRSFGGRVAGRSHSSTG
jgi:hypothetical protein